MPYKDPEKKREFQRKWVAKRRAAWFKGKSCVTCGATERLEIDHIDATTKISHKIFSFSQIRREAELAKCQVLCTPCHRKKSEASLDGTYKFSRAVVDQIHVLSSQGLSGKRIGDQLGMCASHVNKILKGERRS